MLAQIQADGSKHHKSIDSLPATDHNGAMPDHSHPDHDTTASHVVTDYSQLDPDTIISAVETLELPCDARIFPLNSYENRVYQIGLEDRPPVIGKFYRPGRWSNAQILEEHLFTLALAQLEIPVVPPLLFDDRSLLEYAGYRYALYPRQGGRTPELDDPDQLKSLGRFIGRIHALGAAGQFQHRPRIDIDSYAIVPMDFILQQGFMPDYLLDAYQSLMRDILALLPQRYELSQIRQIRLHGDCHRSNILWTDRGPHFVDFDDCRSGPVIQDLWMLLSGDSNEQRRQMDSILDGYYEFYDFNPAELRLIEPLRTMRIIHYAGWLAKRWDDPSFPMNFPWFNTPAYWEQHVLELREQFALLQESETLRL